MTKAQWAERKRQREAHQAMLDAAADERNRVNVALGRGGRAVLQTAFGEYEVRSVSDDWWYACVPVGTPPDDAPLAVAALGRGGETRSFCGCNDGAWASIMRQLGVARHPRFAER